MSGQAVVEAAGVVAATAVLLFAGLCIVANEMFRRRGEPDDESDEGDG